MSGASGSARRQALFGLVLLSLGPDMLLGCAAPAPPSAATVATLSSRPPPVPVVPPHRLIPLPEHKPVPPPAPGGPASEGKNVAMAKSQTAQNGAILASQGQRHELIGLDQRAATRLFGIAAETSERPPFLLLFHP